MSQPPKPLFWPQMLCIRRDQAFNYFPRKDFEEIEPGVFHSEANGRTISLYDSIRNAAQSFPNGVFQAFAQSSGWVSTKARAGSTVRIPLNLPPDHRVFAVQLPAGVMGDVSQGEHLFPYLHHLDEDAIVIGTTAHTMAKGSPVGTFVAQLSFGVYAYDASEDEALKTILYDGLRDLQQRAWAMWIFKLATAAELLADRIVDLHFELRGVSEAVRKRTLRDLRNWPAKLKRVLAINEEFLDEPLCEPLAPRSQEEFQRYVREKRNRFAHSGEHALDRDDAIAAVQASIDILWTCDHLRLALAREVAAKSR